MEPEQSQGERRDGLRGAIAANDVRQLVHEHDAAALVGPLGSALGQNDDRPTPIRRDRRRDPVAHQYPNVPRGQSIGSEEQIGAHQDARASDESGNDRMTNDGAREHERDAARPDREENAERRQRRKRAR